MSKIRVAIDVLSVLAFISAIAIKDKRIALIVMIFCVIVAAVLLFGNIEDVTDLSIINPKMNTLKHVTLFNVFLFGFCAFVVVLTELELIDFSPTSEKYFAAFIVISIITVLGNIAPKIPYNWHTGLRLPWTLIDERTWIFAHRVVGYVSFPIAIFYLAGVVLLDNFKLLSCVTIFSWIGIPSMLSYIYYRKKRL